MWDCANCGEKIEDGFEACWNCRFGKDGVQRIIPEEIGEETKTVLEFHLNANESLSHWAYGIKPMLIETKLFLFVLGILFAALAPLSLQISYWNEWIGRVHEGEPSKIITKIVTLILLVVIATVFYWITKSILMENFAIGLTNQRLIAIHCKNHFQVKELLEYELDNLPLVKSATGTEKAVIEILDHRKPLLVAFHKLESPYNFGQAIKMAATLSAIIRRRASDPFAISYCPQCQAEFRFGFTQCHRCKVELIEFG